jgi:hypothetical protein
LSELSAPIVNREQLADQLARLLHLGMLERGAMGMIVQSIPEKWFVQLREIIEDIGAVAKAGDEEALEKAYRDRPSRRALIEAVLTHARNL